MGPRYSTSEDDLDPGKAAGEKASSLPDSLGRLLPLCLAALALIYAVFAGLRTIGDTDLGWQLATGRWIVQHHAIPSTDVLSHTAQGREWIYPALSQVLLYALHCLGGFPLLSWVGAVTCALTIFILVRRASAATALLGCLAVPMIASRTQPRAEMFTEVCFALFVSVLWRHHRGERSALWLLPITMIFWVNCHLGFIAGLAMCAAYLLLELEEMLWADLRLAAWKRLQQATPWFVATALATLLNPWGARIYIAVARQNAIMRIHSRWIVEWAQIRLNASLLTELLSWRDPKSAMLWLVAAAVVAALASLYRKRAAPAIILGAATYALFHAVRFQGPFAAIAVVLGGAALADALCARPAWERFRMRAALFALLAVLLLVGVRVSDLVSNRYYLQSAEMFSFFGAGETPIFPEKAAEFVRSERLPAELFNDFNSGGSVAWKLGPGYADYIDGRSVPFGAELFLHSEKLLTESPDSPDWEREAQERGIRTIILSLDHGLSGSTLASLPELCSSQHWRPVFLDAYGITLIRVLPETAALIARKGIDCNAVAFDAAPGTLSRAEAFKYELNAASILIVLNRNAEALQRLEQAERIFPQNAYQHYAKGVSLLGLWQLRGAERELTISMNSGSDDAALALSRLLEEQGRYAEEVQMLGKAAEHSSQPQWLYLKMGYAQLALRRPDEALKAFAKAEEHSIFVGEAADVGEAFWQQLRQGRQRAASGRF